MGRLTCIAHPQGAKFTKIYHYQFNFFKPLCSLANAKTAAKILSYFEYRTNCLLPDFESGKIDDLGVSIGYGTLRKELGDLASIKGIKSCLILMKKEGIINYEESEMNGKSNTYFLNIKRLNEIAKSTLENRPFEYFTLDGGLLHGIDQSTPQSRANPSGLLHGIDQSTPQSRASYRSSKDILYIDNIETTKSKDFGVESDLIKNDNITENESNQGEEVPTSSVEDSRKKEDPNSPIADIETDAKEKKPNLVWQMKESVDKFTDKIDAPRIEFFRVNKNGKQSPNKELAALKQLEFTLRRKVEFKKNGESASDEEMITAWEMILIWLSKTDNEFYKKAGLVPSFILSQIEKILNEVRNKQKTGGPLGETELEALQRRSAKRREKRRKQDELRERLGI